jgi:predicted nucleotidyltransferase
MLEGHPLVPRDAAAVAAFAERVRACLGERLVGLRLFGSKARGDAHDYSEIDIAVPGATAIDAIVMASANGRGTSSTRRTSTILIRSPISFHPSACSPCDGGG